MNIVTQPAKRNNQSMIALNVKRSLAVKPETLMSIDAV